MDVALMSLLLTLNRKKWNKEIKRKKNTDATELSKLQAQR